jgi:hypothetical protein
MPVSIPMNNAGNPHKNLRKDCKYRAEELGQILPFKELFIKAKTIPERILVLRSQILPAMFNYWAATGKEPKDESESQVRAKVKRSRSDSLEYCLIYHQELTAWCSNNWRMERGVARKSNKFRPRRADVIWHTRPQDVMKEIGRILNVAEVTTATPGWFPARTPAIKSMIEKMSVGELAALDEEVRIMSRKGYDEKVQRR